jgi:hypothetical protein
MAAMGKMRMPAARLTPLSGPAFCSAGLDNSALKTSSCLGLDRIIR